MKSKGTPKGMGKDEIAALSLERRQQLLVLLSNYGPSNMDFLVTKLGYSKSSIAQWLYAMIETGHVVSTTVLQGRNFKYYERGPNMEPLRAYAHGICKSSYIPGRDAVVKQRTVPARQVGMRRDALVAALFGAGPAVHA